jgi:hypothetical protein
MAWPTDTITTTYLDAGTDDPSQARAEIKTVADKVKEVIAGRATASGVCDLDSSTLVPASRLSGAAITTALGYTPWHAGNDGAASGLDADTLDTYHASSFLLKAGGAMTGELDLNSQDVDNAKTITFIAEVDNGNSGTADTIDWNAGQKQKSTLTGAVTFTFTAPQGPCNLILKLVQGGTGSYNPTWPTAVKWPGATEPTWSTAVGAVDIVSFYYDGTNYYAQAGIGFA